MLDESVHQRDGKHAGTRARANRNGSKTNPAKCGVKSRKQRLHRTETP